MYGELVKELRDSAEWADRLALLMGRAEGDTHAPIMRKAADAIEELQKSVLRLEEASGIIDELPMVDQSTPCDTCVHKGNVDFDYCHICNNEADMYKPRRRREE